MAVTRSTAQDRAHTRARPPLGTPVGRNLESGLVILVTIAVAVGLFFTYRSQTSQLAGAPLNLNALQSAEPLMPLLDMIEAPAEREFVARRIYQRVTEEMLPNVGALSRIGITKNEISSRFPQLRARAAKGDRVPLLTSAEIRELKPKVAVRTPADYRRSLLLWCALFFLPFVLVHMVWIVRRFEGHQTILPIVLALSGIGLTLMLSLRDPVRDMLSFADFSQGAMLGCVAIVAASFLDFQKLAGRLTYLPLLAAVVLSAMLIIFGSGPGSSDAKVNLFGFQPVEAIKILAVFFLAGYFAKRWEFLRVLKEKQAKWVEVPRLEYLLPLLSGLALMILFFFLQKDLGPALVISALFLILYGVARGRYLFAALGFAAVLSAFLAGYALGFPRTVAARVAMWLSPWDNRISGGEQVVHSLWGMATGGFSGTGLGWGDPEIMPAAHTDLILAVVGEELGFLGILTVALLWAALFAIGFRIALRSKSDFSFFLALGLTLLLALETLLITGGVLDVLPLSGVASPFLSYGKSAAVANFFIAGALLALSRDNGKLDETKPFWEGSTHAAWLVAALAVVILVKAGYIQTIAADATVGRGVLAYQADGFRRYQYNPRLLAIARGIPRGTVFSAEGLPLATSDWRQIEEKRASFAKIGVTLPRQAPQGDERFYPLGASAVHLLGDLRSRANWSARNSSLIERDSGVRLQGFDDRAQVMEVDGSYTIKYDYRELVPLLRRRRESNHPEVRKVLDRERDVQTSIHAGLQWRVAGLLRDHIRKLGKRKGAVVVIEPESGDTLASVSYPWPAQMPPSLRAQDSDDTMLDRARYGLYPPGSTFKLVTALAALRKDPSLAQAQYSCERLPDGRVGAHVRGWGRPIRDDIADRTPHGTVDLERATIVSCNAYYAQLGTYRVGPEQLLQTADLFGISVARPNTAAKLKDALPQAAYGQGQVVASPFQMARVVASIANNGNAPQGRWVIDESNSRIQPSTQVVAPALANTLARYMRGVVTNGTGRAAAASIPVAGKTGTAEVEKQPSHAWFVGFAPHGRGRKIAFTVLVENGQYGGSAAAPLAAQVVSAATQLGLTGASTQ